MTAEYGRALREGARRAGLGWEEAAAEAGVSPMTAWRVENGQGSLKAAEALRAVLAARWVDLPPPAFATTDKLARWFQLGRDLRDLSPAQFDRVLDQVEQPIDAERRVRDGISLIEA